MVFAPGSLHDTSSNYKYKHHCDSGSLDCHFGLSRISEMILTGAAMFKDTKSAVSLAGVFASPTKSALSGMEALKAPTGRQSRLSADISRES